MKDKFLTNYSNETFLERIKHSLEKCNSFAFSVSFIKKPGLILFEKIMEEALIRGVKGKIITSTYKDFTDIASLRTFYNWMKKYPNFKCHIDFNCFGDNGFHTKGYLFTFDNTQELIIGSSNITRFALLKNMEWNIALNSDSKMDSAEEASKEFEDFWNKTKLLNEDIIKQYQMQMDYAIDK